MVDSKKEKQAYPVAYDIWSDVCNPAIRYCVLYMKQPSPFKAASLRPNLSAWQEIGAPAEVLGWIEHGIHIPFVTDPGKFHIPIKGRQVSGITE